VSQEIGHLRSTRIGLWKFYLPLARRECLGIRSDSDSLDLFGRGQMQGFGSEQVFNEYNVDYNSAEEAFKLRQEFADLEARVRDFEERYSGGYQVGKFGKFSLVGHGEVTNFDCGRFRTLKGCLRVDLHNHVDLVTGVNYSGKVYVMPVFHSCDKPSCPKCFLRGWAMREADRMEQRLKEGSKRFGEVFHIVVSPDTSDYGLSFEKLKAKLRKALLSRGVVGGAFIFHAFRYASFEESVRKRVPYGWRWSPHFHVLGFIVGGFRECRRCPYVNQRGSRWRCEGCEGFYGRSKSSYVKDRMIVEVMGKRKSIFNTCWYQLNHATIHEGSHTVTWFGSCSYRKLKFTPEKRKKVCPICGSELVPVNYHGDRVIVVNRDSWEFKSHLLMDLCENGCVVWTKRDSGNYT
jgi:hypothetical protein